MTTKMCKIRVEADMDPVKSRIFIDGEEMRGVRSVEYKISADSKPLLILSLYDSDLEIVGPADVEIVRADTGP